MFYGLEDRRMLNRNLLVFSALLPLTLAIAAATHARAVGQGRRHGADRRAGGRDHAGLRAAVGQPLCLPADARSTTACRRISIAATSSRSTATSCSSPQADMRSLRGVPHPARRCDQAAGPEAGLRDLHHLRAARRRARRVRAQPARQALRFLRQGNLGLRSRGSASWAANQAALERHLAQVRQERLRCA